MAKKVSKSEALYKSGPKKGRLKPGYYFDLDGTPRKTAPKKRTPLYSQAKALGEQRARKAGQKLKKAKKTATKKPVQKGLF